MKTEKERRKHNQKHCIKHARKRLDGKGVLVMRRKLLLAYKMECAICGWNIKAHKKNRSGVEIHHIKRIMDDGKTNFDNCIVLCPNCHTLADMDIISKEKLEKFRITEEVKEIRRINYLIEIHNKIIK